MLDIMELMAGAISYRYTRRLHEETRQGRSPLRRHSSISAIAPNAKTRHKDGAQLDS